MNDSAPTEDSQRFIQNDVPSIESLHNQGSAENGLAHQENFIVGISPSYWSHVPMHVVDILSLTLSQGGINFLHGKIPVSKCLIVGYIVNLQTRSDGSIMYAIDDGTGLIDCVSYVDIDSYYDLPDLFSYSKQRRKSSNDYQIGDLVRVFGKMKNLARVNSVVVRELQVKLMELVTYRHETHSDAEVQHWMACSNVLSPQNKTSTVEECLQLLGPQIQSQVFHRQVFPSSDDTCGAWKVFGTSCQCTESYKHSLLYCHCQAKVDLLDPNLKFRDAVLDTLLELQRSKSKLLSFTYKEIKHHPHLTNLAARVVAHQQGPDFMVNELFRNTFSALRKDGIIYLNDKESDVYVLLSRELALEPFVRGRMKNQKARNFISLQDAPGWISRVDKEKLLYIQRCILQDEAQTASK
jgi:hypothetical protein